MRCEHLFAIVCGVAFWIEAVRHLGTLAACAYMQAELAACADWLAEFAHCADLLAELAYCADQLAEVRLVPNCWLSLRLAQTS